MKGNNATFDRNDQSLKFDFDEWVELYQQDPEAFEERRLQWCNQLIDSAPTACQRRLTGMLFQINMQKRQSANAMDSCLRISRLMWEKFHELREELQSFMQLPVDPPLAVAQSPAGPSRQLSEPLHDAEILPFAPLSPAARTGTDTT